MTIITKKLNMAKKNANKAVITVLAAFAMLAVAPKAHATEAKSAKDTITQKDAVEVQKENCKMFQEAVKANKPYEEIAKYVNFPDFIPVDENGQLDKGKLQMLIDNPIINHTDALVKFYNSIQYSNESGKGYSCGGHMGGITHIEPHKEWFDKALATFIKDISENSKETEEFLKKVAEANDDYWGSFAHQARDKLSTVYHNDTMTKLEPWVNLWFYCALCTFIGGAGFFALTPSKEQDKKTTTNVIANAFATAFVFLGVANGILTFYLPWKISNEELASQKKAFADPKEIKEAIAFFQEGVEKIYDSYLTETIQTEKYHQEAIEKAQLYQKYLEFLKTQEKQKD